MARRFPNQRSGREADVAPAIALGRGETIRSMKGGQMSTSHPVFTARIEGSQKNIFDLVADMPNCGRWLPGSEACGGTTEVSPYPVRLGTTYLDSTGAVGTPRPRLAWRCLPSSRVGTTHAGATAHWDTNHRCSSNARTPRHLRGSKTAISPG